MSNRFEIKKGRNGQYHFVLKAKNGQVILSSEMYVRKQSALNGIKAVKARSINLSSFQEKESVNGKHFFVLKAANGEIIGTSEIYESEEGMLDGIDSVIANGPISNVVEVQNSDEEE